VSVAGKKCTTIAAVVVENYLRKPLLEQQLRNSVEIKGSTSSGNLYSQMNVGDEFLRSARSFHFYAQGGQILMKLFWGAELDSDKAQ
jgi:hypothetical protein